MAKKERGISTLIGVIIIVIAAVLIFGGVFAYQYYTTKSEAQNPKSETNQNAQNSNVQNETASAITEKDLLGYWKIGEAEPIAFCDYDPISGLGEYRSYLHERPAEWGTWKIENRKLIIQYDIPGEKPIVIDSVQRTGNTLSLNGAPEFNGSYTLTMTCDGKAVANNETAGWKTYIDQQLSFKYPDSWDQIRKNNLLGYEGNYFVTDYSLDKPIEVSAYSLGTKPFESTIFNKKQIDINWNAEQFAQNMGFSSKNVLFTKKIGNKSMLVAMYENYECSPAMILSVLTPFNSSFPNIEFRIWKLGENKDIKNLIDKNSADVSTGKGDPCDWYDIIKAEADKIYDGTYSAEVTTNIETASQMADSLIIK